jgi:hypothetical protein
MREGRVDVHLALEPFLEAVYTLDGEANCLSYLL